MAKRNIAICILVLLAFGCAKYKELTRFKEFDQISVAYEHAIRWSDFDYAAAFVYAADSEDQSPSPEIIKLVRVTDYIVRQTAASKDENQVVRIVVISYYRSDKMVVNSFTERELWLWDDEKKQWHLKSGLPDFE